MARGGKGTSGWRGVLASGLVAYVVMPAAAYSASPAVAVPSLDNGGFEGGSLSSWSANETGLPGDGWSAVAGRWSPFSDFRIPAPPEGGWQAVADQSGPGSHVLYRDIVVSTEPLELDLTLWFRNRAGRFFAPRTLSAFRRHTSAHPNQQLRIDLMEPTAGLRSLGAEDILAAVFRTRRGDATRLGPTPVHLDLTAFEGQTVRLRIAEVDNQGFFQVGVDEVRLVSLPPCTSGCA